MAGYRSEVPQGREVGVSPAAQVRSRRVLTIAIRGSVLKAPPPFGIIHYIRQENLTTEAQRHREKQGFAFVLKTTDLIFYFGVLSVSVPLW